MMKQWLVFSALAGSAAVQVAAQASPQTIRIDAGGIELELVDAPMDPPFELTYRPQGQCRPEVAITRENGVTTARHTKSCHGTGDYEVTLTGTGLENYRDLRFATRVGGISGERPDLPWDKRRKWLVGAEASAQRDSGCCTMAIRVDYGGISVR